MIKDCLPLRYVKDTLEKISRKDTRFGEKVDTIRFSNALGELGAEERDRVRTRVGLWVGTSVRARARTVTSMRIGREGETKDNAESEGRAEGKVKLRL